MPHLESGDEFRVILNVNSATAIMRQVTKRAFGFRALGPATLYATTLKVLLDEAGTEVNVELNEW